MHLSLSISFLCVFVSLWWFFYSNLTRLGEILILLLIFVCVGLEWQRKTGATYMKRKIRVGIVFGGKSAEHEVSLLSAKNVVESIDQTKYEPVLIGIDKNGEWHLRDEARFLLNSHDPKRIQLHPIDHPIALVPKEEKQALVSLKDAGHQRALDVIFPVLHGTYGEDGTIQGLLKMANIPFVGAGVLGSAVGMDKDVMKRLMRDAGIPVAKFLTIYRHQQKQFDFNTVKQALGFPFFIKPANLGSSVGVHKVQSEADFNHAVADAFLYDHKILAEECICGKEVECAVMGNTHPIASLPGEVVLSQDSFHSYDEKYLPGRVDFQIPANVSPQIQKEIQELAIRTYQTVCCEGMARVDLFVNQQGKVLVNEINTIPGFTKTSAFPKLWSASGVPQAELIDKLITFAFERFDKEQQLKTTV
jgi:D-alanine-D-alanine ligase